MIKGGDIVSQTTHPEIFTEIFSFFRSAKNCEGGFLDELLHVTLGL